MSSVELSEQSASDSPSNQFSMSAFFHDAYDKGVVTTIMNRPAEAALMAAAATAATAAVCLTRGSALQGLLKSGAAEEAGNALRPAGDVVKNAMTPASEILANTSVPMMAESRAAAAASGAEALKVAATEKAAESSKLANYMDYGHAIGPTSPTTEFIQSTFGKNHFKEVPISQHLNFSPCLSSRPYSELIPEVRDIYERNKKFVRVRFLG